MKVATDAVQVFGGYGYSSEYPVDIVNHRFSIDTNLQLRIENTSLQLLHKTSKSKLIGKDRTLFTFSITANKRRYSHFLPIPSLAESANITPLP